MLYPKHFDDKPTSSDGAELARKLKGLVMNKDDGQSDAESTTATEQLDARLRDADTKVSKKKPNKPNRSTRRGGIKKTKKHTVADTDSDTAYDADVDKYANTDDGLKDNTDADEEGEDSEGTTVILSPMPAKYQPPPLPFPPIELPNPLPSVPVLAHYERRSIPGAANPESPNSEGLFATQDIAEGTRVICEAPLISLPAPGDNIDQIWNAYSQLSDVDKTTFWALKTIVPKGTEADMYSVHADGLIPIIMGIHDKKPEDKTEKEKELYETLAPKVEVMCTVWRVAARFHAHRYALIDDSQDLARVSKEQHVTGLFAEAAHLRHSCMPNCFCTFNPFTGRMTVHAVKPIAVDEELTVSCITKSAFYENHATRKELLLDTASITCACPACDETNPSYGAHALNHSRLYAAAAYLNDILTKLDIQENTAQYQDLGNALSDIPAGYSPERLVDLENKVIEVIKLLKAVGCADAEEIRWRQALRDYLLPRRGQWMAALAQAKLAEKRGVLCFGEDNMESVRLGRDVRRLEGIVQREREKAEREGQ